MQLQTTVRRCSKHLRSAATLAEITAAGPELGHAAGYLLDALRDLAPDLRKLRRLLRKAPHLAAFVGLALLVT